MSFPDNSRQQENRIKFFFIKLVSYLIIGFENEDIKKLAKEKNDTINNTIRILIRDDSIVSIFF